MLDLRVLVFLGIDMLDYANQLSLTEGTSGSLARSEVSLVNPLLVSLNVCFDEAVESLTRLPLS